MRSRFRLIAASVIAVAAMTTAQTVTSHSAAAEEADSSATPNTRVVINEVAPEGPWGPLDEFVELANTTTKTISLADWQIYACEPGNPAVLMFTFPAWEQLGSVQSLNNTVVLGGIFFSGGFADYIYSRDTSIWGGWMLKDNFGRYVDAMGFSNSLPCTEAHQPAPQCNWAAGEAATRIAGLDTDNNWRDFHCMPRSPHQMNTSE